MYFLFDLPSKDTINRNKKIKILTAPSRLQDVDEFEYAVPKVYYLRKGFKEVIIYIAPERTPYGGGNVQAQQKQYDFTTESHQKFMLQWDTNYLVQQ